MVSPQPVISQEQRVRMMTIIWIAMITGVVVFAIIAGIQGLDQKPQNDMLLTFMGMGLAAFMFVACLIVPNIVANQQFRAAMNMASLATEEQKTQFLTDLGQVYVTKLLIGLALLEGGAFLNLVFFMVEGQILAYIPVLILVMTMIALKPSKSKLDAWIRNQMENYNLEHQN